MTNQQTQTEKAYQVVPWTRVGSRVEFALIDVQKYRESGGDYTAVLGLASDQASLAKLHKIADMLNSKLEAMPEHGHYTITLDKETFEQLAEVASFGKQFTVNHPFYQALKIVTDVIGESSAIDEEIQKQYTPEGIVKALVQRAHKGLRANKGVQV